MVTFVDYRESDQTAEEYLELGRGEGVEYGSGSLNAMERKAIQEGIARHRDEVRECLSEITGESVEDLEAAAEDIDL